jgi:hypothetical protein
MATVSHLGRRLAVLVAAGVLAAACGAGNGGQGSTSATAAPEGFSVSVASYDLAVGPTSRLLVGLTTLDERLVTGGTVTTRLAYLGTRRQAVTAAPSATVTGRYLPIPGSPPGTPGKPVVATGSQARGVYAAQVGFDRAGFWGVQVLADITDTGPRSGTSQFEVFAKHQVPFVGDRALPTRNLTVRSTGVAKAAIDSRAVAGGKIPDPELHQTTIAEALAAKRPAVVVFSTPVYCVSRFCGPVTDMVQQLATKYRNRAAFIHIEIWRDFEKQAVNKAAADWLYRGGDLQEPWVFVIGADGRITARFDNVATRGELEPLLQRLP